jgi:DNA-binding HxlR family transcriptional regulator
MRSYEQYCAVAKALDVVGDRWTLLIVRELLLRDASRYTDLMDGLPGIATNLLANRLRELEEADVLRRIDAPPPIATTLYELTPRGRELASVLEALGRWGSPLMTKRADSEEFRAYWLAFPAMHLLTDAAPKDPPVTIEVRTNDDVVRLETVDGAVRAMPGPAEHPDAVLTGPPDAILGLLMGRVEFSKAKRRGLRLEGSIAAVRRLQPVAGHTAN